jgi:hypothetical protein
MRKCGNDRTSILVGCSYDGDIGEPWTKEEMMHDFEAQMAQIAKASKLLPAWFTRRMMSDTWYFGLLLDCGYVVGISCILDIRQDAAGALWIDFETLENPRGCVQGHLPAELMDRMTGTVAEGRNEMTIQASKIVAAFELAYT